MSTLTGVRLADLRRRRMLTQVELAVAAGVAPATISKLERVLERGERRAPQMRVVRLVSAALGVDPSEVDEFREPYRPTGRPAVPPVG